MIINSKIIAHRGIYDNIKVPENSIKAFKKAIDLNYPFELDVQMTSDGEIVVFHDDNLKRLTGIDKNLSDCSYEEVKNLKLNNTFNHIPLFEDVLKLNNDKSLILIEIKSTKYRKQIIDKIMNLLDGYSNYIIQSFDPKIVKYIKKHYSDIVCGLLLHHNYDNFFLNIILKSSFILRYSKCDFVSLSKKLLKNKKYMRKIDGYEKCIWTIKSNEEMKLDNDIHYICDELPFK